MCRCTFLNRGPLGEAITARNRSRRAPPFRKSLDSTQNCAVKQRKNCLTRAAVNPSQVRGQRQWQKQQQQQEQQAAPPCAGEGWVVINTTWSQMDAPGRDSEGKASLGKSNMVVHAARKRTCSLAACNNPACMPPASIISCFLTMLPSILIMGYLFVSVSWLCTVPPALPTSSPPPNAPHPRPHFNASNPSAIPLSHTVDACLLPHGTFLTCSDSVTNLTLPTGGICTTRGAMGTRQGGGWHA